MLTKQPFLKDVKELLINERGVKCTLQELSEIYNAMNTIIYNHLMEQEDISVFGVRYTYKNVEARSGVMNGVQWEKPAHKAVHIKKTKPLKEITFPVD